MRAPDYLLKRGITSLVCVGDGRQSGTSGCPSILNASPEAASNGGLALVETGDRVVLDLNDRPARSADRRRGTRAAAQGAGGGGRLPVPGPPDSVAGDPARPRRGAGDRRGSGAGGEVPAHRADQGNPARQPLIRSPADRFARAGTLTEVSLGLIPENLSFEISMISGFASLRNPDTWVGFPRHGSNGLRMTQGGGRSPGRHGIP